MVIIGVIVIVLLLIIAFDLSCLVGNSHAINQNIGSNSSDLREMGEELTRIAQELEVIRQESEYVSGQIGTAVDSLGDISVNTDPYRQKKRDADWLKT